MSGAFPLSTSLLLITSLTRVRHDNPKIHSVLDSEERVVRAGNRTMRKGKGIKLLVEKTFRIPTCLRGIFKRYSSMNALREVVDNNKQENRFGGIKAHPSNLTGYTTFTPSPPTIPTKLLMTNVASVFIPCVMRRTLRSCRDSSLGYTRDPLLRVTSITLSGRLVNG